MLPEISVVVARLANSVSEDCLAPQAVSERAITVIERVRIILFEFEVVIVPPVYQPMEQGVCHISL